MLNSDDNPALQTRNFGPIAAQAYKSPQTSLEDASLAMTSFPSLLSINFPHLNHSVQSFVINGERSMHLLAFNFE